nr:SDR family NAD(P)-dependent oxidoreductase [Halorhodospira abdelmalekii]
MVTGAAGGIGNAVCRQLAAAGATLVLLDKEIKPLERLYDRIIEAGDPEPAIYPMNLEGASFDHFPEVGQRIHAELGRLDALLHAAAALGKPAPLELYDVEAWYRTLQVNLNAPFMLTRACLPLLRQADQSAVLFTSDHGGRYGAPYGGAYAVANAGIEGMMRVLAAEMADTTTVRVNSLDPGVVGTALRAQAFPFENPFELRRPEQVAGAFVRLLGPDGREFHGQALTIAEH